MRKTFAVGKLAAGSAEIHVARSDQERAQREAERLRALLRLAWKPLQAFPGAVSTTVH